MRRTWYSAHGQVSSCSKGGEDGPVLAAAGVELFQQASAAEQVRLRVEADRCVLQAQHPSRDLGVGAHPVQVCVQGAH